MAHDKTTVSESRFLPDEPDGPDTLGDHTFKVRARTSAGWGAWDYKTVTIARDQLLTAEWLDAPLKHDYPASFTMTLQFSKEVDITENQLRNYAIGYDGATIAGVQATTPGSTRSWTVTLTPNSRSAPVYAGVWQVQSWETCDQMETICADGEKLSADAMVMVAAP